MTTDLLDRIESRISDDEARIRDLRDRADNPKLATSTRAKANAEANALAAKVRAWRRGDRPAAGAHAHAGILPDPPHGRARGASHYEYDD